jgi:peptidoglycan/xylan/chitin deacetylase (PgdA/CDA1 family)
MRRNPSAELARAACSLVPSSFWRTFSTVNPVAAYYHIVSDVEVAHTRYLYKCRTVAQFQNDIDTFCKVFHPISLLDLIGSLATGRAVPPKSLLLTFDDGFSEIYDVIAPILRQKGVPATFFLTTACLDNKHLAHHNRISLLIERMGPEQTNAATKEIRNVLGKIGVDAAEIPAALLGLDHREQQTIDTIASILNVDFASYLSTAKPYLTSDQVRSLIAMGFTIGGHSVDHPLFAAISLGEQLDQTRTSVRFVRERFSLNYGAFAFPHGHNRVGAEFFDQLFPDGGIDVCFGTAGIVKSAVPRHFHRFSMENSSLPAERILAGAFARSVYKAWVGGA